MTDDELGAERLSNMSREEFRAWFSALTPERQQEFKEALEEIRSISPRATKGESPTDPAPTSQ